VRVLPHADAEVQPALASDGVTFELAVFFEVRARLTHKPLTTDAAGTGIAGRTH